MNPTALASVAAGAAVLAVLYVAGWLDRYRFEQVPALAFCALWGGAVAAGWLLLLRPAFDDRAARLGPAAWPPVGLMLAVLVVLAAMQAAGPSLLGVGRPAIGATDWLVRAVAGGATFAAAVGVVAAVRPPGLPLSGLALLHASSLLGTALLGLGLAHLVRNGSWSSRTSGVAIVAAAPVVQLSLFGVGAGAAATLAPQRAWLLAGLCAGALASSAIAAWMMEGKAIAGELAEEVRLGVIPESAAETVPSFVRRIRSAWWPTRSERRALNQLLITLALRKRSLRGLDPERASIYSLEVGRLRARARQILGTSPPVRAEERPA